MPFLIVCTCICFNGASHIDEIVIHNLANQAVEREAGMDGQKITYALIKHRLGDLFYRLVSQKFEDPAEGEEALVAKFKKLHEDLTGGFRNLDASVQILAKSLCQDKKQNWRRFS
ncbi:unnamed protein product [Fraxinus pennsylvanica]|uniref:Uncharacterized protein n=1 Tax=Fraxinus pennsylvanica TaxID=56036 RepID=A0AAD1ZGY1_9LAMI|nr:unnamed protein product [Fraxinus pennsylvanica]